MNNKPNNSSQNVYSKREKSELFLFRGIPNSTSIEMPLGKEKMYHFVKPTNVVFNIESKYMQKYNYNIEYTKNSIIKKMLQNPNNFEGVKDNVFNTTISKINSSKSLLDKTNTTK